MKKITLIIGIVIILLLIAVWSYLLFFSTSSPGENNFALFNFGDTTDTSVPPEEFTNTTEDEPVVDVMSPEQLRQLTLKPTIGHQEVKLSTTSNPLVYFVEAGTGHIYSINLQSGEENRVSNITVPVARQAAISTDGKYAVVRSKDGDSSELIFITLPTSNTTLSSRTLSDTSENFEFTANGELLYAVTGTNVTSARVYNPESETSRTLFEIPFREAVVEWGSSADATHYAYPKPSEKLLGYLYSFTAGTMERLPVSGYGLSLVATDEYVLYSTTLAGKYETYIYNQTLDTTTKNDVSLLPEKCTLFGTNAGVSICSHTPDSDQRNFPDAWNSGEAEVRDNLFVLLLDYPQTDLMYDVSEKTGRELNFTNIKRSDEGDLLLTNRSDATLWYYENSDF